MQQSQYDAETQYANEVATINQYSLSKMGLQAGRTVVKLGDFPILCQPYRLSMKGAVLIASLSPQELVSFQRFKNDLSGLTLLFDDSGGKELKIFARCVVTAIEKMKGKDTIGLIAVDFRPCPPDLATKLIDFFTLQNRLKVEYDDFKTRPIAINPESASKMGYNSLAQIIVGTKSCNIALFSISSAKVWFLVPLNGPELTQDLPVHIKLSFDRYQFIVSGKVLEIQILQNRVQKTAVELNFSPELVSVIEDFYFGNYHI